ncbi:MAG: glycosyltransferase [Phenylobacterium sp.]
MKILIVGSSPYLLTNNGKMVSCLLRYLKVSHNVAVAAWHHDRSYFPPNSDGKFSFENDSNNICDLYPISYNHVKSTPEVYDIVKVYRPDLIISVGDYIETSFIFAIKTYLPNTFKWANIVLSSSEYINPAYQSSFAYADYIAATTSIAAKAISKFYKRDVAVVRFGPNDSFSPSAKNNDGNDGNELNVMCCSKNSQVSNLPILIKAIADVNKNYDIKVNGYIHTNIQDLGDYDLLSVVDQFDAKEFIIFPDKVSSLNDGYYEEDLNKLYNSNDIICDLSLKSATGLSILEGMKTGCLPLCNDVGALGEILYGTDYLIDNNVFYGQFNEVLKFVSYNALVKKLQYLYDIKANDSLLFGEKQRESIKIANNFSENIFLKGIEQVIAQIVNMQQNIVVVENF